MSEKLSEITVEISGAAVAGLQRIYVEADDDVLLEMQGDELVTDTSENNDQFTVQTSRKKRFVLQNWALAHKDSVTEMIRDASKVKLEDGFVGFIRLRKGWNTTEPSYLDRRIMKSLQQLQKKFAVNFLKSNIHN